MALDWTRSQSPADDDSAFAAAGTAGVPFAEVAPPEEPGVAEAPPVAAPPAAEALPTVEATIPVPERVIEEPVRRAPEPRPAPASSRETPNDLVVPSVRVARNTVTAPPVAAPPVVRGEVPDDYVVPRRAPTGEAGAVAARESATPPPASRTAATTQPLASVVRQPGPLVEPLGTSSSASPPTVTTAPPPPAAAPAAAMAAVVTPSEVNRVRSVLNQYASAYGTLDARAVRAVWPTVDQRALQRAFDDLSSQKVSFDTCEIDVNGATAHASCLGTASYVGKVGSGTERRTVKFELKREGDAWRIQKADTRR
jgi:hypothetical protein